jgi:nucleoside-diphosphate kinase
LSSKPQLTLLVIKPDAVRRRLVGEIIHRVEAAGFAIRAVRFKQLTRDEASRFYAVHQGKNFFDGLVEFMTSGPVMALLIEQEDACRRLRELVGATDPSEAAHGTIRADFGTSVRENVVHASNPEENPEQEIRFYFENSETERTADERG